MIIDGKKIAEGIVEKLSALPTPKRSFAGVLVGDDPASGRLRLHKSLAWVHGAGMILLPLLGVLAANPQMLGLDPSTDPGTVRDFQSAMRSVHTIVGYTTFAAFSFSAALELF